MTVFDDAQAIAKEVLGDPELQSGSVVSLVQKTPGTGAADNPGEPTSVTIPLEGAIVIGVPFKYLKGGFNGLANRGSDSFVVSTDLLVTAAVVDGITPTKNDFVVIDGIEYKIIEDVSAPAAGTRVVWKFLVRK